MPPRGFKTISVPEETYKEIEVFLKEEEEFLRKRGIRSISSWAVSAINETISREKTRKQSLTSKQYWQHYEEKTLKLKAAHKILIIDDDIDLCETLKIMFEQEGYDISIANTGKEAIEKTKNNFYNAALVDLSLPDISSNKLLELLATISPDMIRIVITGQNSLEIAINAINLGAAGYITKPINPEKLLVTIKTKISGKKQHYEITQERIFNLIQDKVSELIKEKNY